MPEPALWSLRFSSDMGIHRGGIVVIEDGKILGGDSGFTYVGRLRTERSRMIANLRVAKYLVGAPPIFGMDNFEAELSAQPDEHQLSFTGFIVGSPGNSIAVDMVRRVELS